jgi:hypothetical protein
MIPRGLFDAWIIHVGIPYTTRPLIKQLSMHSHKHRALFLKNTSHAVEDKNFEGLCKTIRISDWRIFQFNYQQNYPNIIPPKLHFFWLFSGVESWTFYFKNGFLNFNIFFIFALISLPVVVSMNNIFIENFSNCPIMHNFSRIWMCDNDDQNFRWNRSSSVVVL